jgi:hypothetical protein
VPRNTGRFGFNARSRWAEIRFSSTTRRITSSSIISILATSCDVLNPSKKWRNGTRDSRVARWETNAMSWASWTEAEASMANPVCRAAITSEWSPKIESAWVAIDRAATWMTAGVSSPAILNMLGSMRSKPCEEVKVVVSAPA